MNAAGGDGVLGVLATQDERQAHPRMIVERAVVVAAQEVMQVDVEPAVAWNDEPALEIRSLGAPDHKVRRPTRDVRDDVVANHARASPSSRWRYRNRICEFLICP